ncbi:Formyl-coenzyme A transferase [Achromobacter xylosoxidans]|uniref:CaiB/BaiF CoA transferase family protein n=1 Tax=Alcaligenes xylosoxydans xylosoxydans TaxID=85698 RepID=UPI0006C2BDF2|nr:CaiB/BaiF CoA-transferase family protein [Achromobacter xylosoxidans]CUJ31539.1 Formyl-coenzyme A transferase [Achromobacter xylosoxidans]CUJ71593.1 Formyl-coenzyme A transferase [Achromobacter xylosoxidans]
MSQPLKGIKVLDFSTLLPGPMCTLILAEAGADVIKLERASGDEMRGYSPRFGDDSVNFVLLNRGKRSACLDLKADADRARVLELVRDVDVVVEQFRPGVMQRLGLDYERLSQINPGLVYCSITTYGQHGPKALRASHDLNFQAETGMLALSADANGAPIVPPTLTGDIAAGAYPAVVNILLALRQRDMDGKGQHLDISMTDNLFTLMYWALGNGWSEGKWPRPGKELVTGGSLRYAIYRTSDGRYLSAAPLEDRFWNNFLTLIGAADLVGEKDEEAMRAEVERIIASEPASHWLRKFDGHDVCVSEAVNIEQAVQDPHFKARGIFDCEVVNSSGRSMPALPVPVCRSFRSGELRVAAPVLGEHTNEIAGHTTGDHNR